MRAGQPGPQSAKIAGPAAKMWASGPRARSKSRPAYRAMIFQSFFYEKSKLNFFRLIMILSRISKRVYLCLFEYANTRKHVYEHSCSSMRVCWSILAHLAHLAQFFFLDFKCNKWINILYTFEQAATREHVSEQTSILAHLAHLAYFLVANTQL